MLRKLLGLNGGLFVGVRVRRVGFIVGLYVGLNVMDYMMDIVMDLYLH